MSDSKRVEKVRDIIKACEGHKATVTPNSFADTWLKWIINQLTEALK